MSGSSRRIRPRAYLKRRHRRRRRRRLPSLSVLPTLFTLGNLVCGFTAIHFAAQPIGDSGFLGWSSLTVAGGQLIFLGMFFDTLDGSVARMVDSVTDLGAQLDSLADVVTFGVAPAFMMLRLVSHYVGSDVTVILGPDADNFLAKATWGVAAAYLCGTALRLARFNVETQPAGGDGYLIFRGLPSPGAAGAVASMIVLHQKMVGSFVDVPVELARGTAFCVPVVALLCAIGMVSSLPYVHVMNRYIRRRATFGYVARMVLILALIIWSPYVALAIGFTVYALSAPIRWLLRWRRSSTSREMETTLSAS